jgi:hypothetical protein
MMTSLQIGILMGVVAGLTGSLVISLAIWVARRGPAWLQRYRTAREDAAATSAMQHDTRTAYLSATRDLAAIRHQRDVATQNWTEWEAKAKRLMAERAAREAAETAKGRTRTPTKRAEKKR